MGLTKYQIGQLVEPVSIKCGIPKCDYVSGVNIFKQFMPSRNVGADTSKYLIVPPGGFAFNLMQSNPISWQQLLHHLVVNGRHLTRFFLSHIAMPNV